MRRILGAALLLAVLSPTTALGATKTVWAERSGSCFGSPSKRPYARFDDYLSYSSTRVKIESSKTQGKVYGCSNQYLYPVSKLKLFNDFGFYGAKITSCGIGFPSGVSCSGSSTERHRTANTGPKYDAATITADFSGGEVWADAGGYISSYSHQTTVNAINGGNDHYATASKKVGL